MFPQAQIKPSPGLHNTVIRDSPSGMLLIQEHEFIWVSGETRPEFSSYLADERGGGRRRRVEESSCSRLWLCESMALWQVVHQQNPFPKTTRSLAFTSCWSHDLQMLQMFCLTVSGLCCFSSYHLQWWLLIGYCM